VLRVGLVGCGFIGRVHSWALWAVRKAGLVDVRVTAVCDHDAERARDLAEPNEAEVLELGPLLDQVDAVYVCTPTVMHLPVVEAAAARGLPIYCEKPLAPSLEEAQRVAAALRTVTHRVGLVMRCAPVFEALVEIVRSGRYGRPMTLVMRDDQYFPIQGQYGSTWRKDLATAGGGTLIEHSIHDLDLIRWILGDATEVSCRTRTFFGHEGIDDVATAMLAYADGATANLVSVWHQVLTRGSSRRLEVFCEDAFLYTEDDNTGPVFVETSQGAETVECEAPPWVAELPVPVESRKVLGLYAEASRRFLDAIASKSAGSPGEVSATHLQRGGSGGRSAPGRMSEARPERGGSGGRSAPGEEDAVAAHRLVDAAYRSASRGGVPISLGDRNTGGGETS
jgi:myo-inositol 2-dehydrogenase / D-chiro-inositol 1-dehydrogenase